MGRETDYPGKRERKAKPVRATCMLLAHHDGQLYLERRPSAGIWGGLWSLPEIADRDALEQWCSSRLGAAPHQVIEWALLRHSFSHYDLDILPLEVRLDSASSRVADSNDRQWIALGAPAALGLAAPVRTLIDQLSDVLSDQSISGTN